MPGPAKYREKSLLPTLTRPHLWIGSGKGPWVTRPIWHGSRRTPVTLRRRTHQRTVFSLVGSKRNGSRSRYRLKKLESWFVSASLANGLKRKGRKWSTAYYATFPAR